MILLNQNQKSRSTINFLSGKIYNKLNLKISKLIMIQILKFNKKIKILNKFYGSRLAISSAKKIVLCTEKEILE